MRSWVLAVLFLVASVVPIMAVDDTAKPSREPGGNFEEVKTDILRRIDDRIAREQQVRGCVQAAKSNADIQVCREKYRPKRDGERPNNRPGKAEPPPAGR